MAAVSDKLPLSVMSPPLRCEFEDLSLHGSRVTHIVPAPSAAACINTRFAHNELHEVEKTTPGTKESCLIHPLSVMRRWVATTASRGVRQVERGLLLEVQREAQWRVFFFSKCLVSAAGQTSRASRLIRMAPLSTVSGSASFIVVQGRAHPVLGSAGSEPVRNVILVLADRPQLLV